MCSKAIKISTKLGGKNNEMHTNEQKQTNSTNRTEY